GSTDNTRPDARFYQSLASAPATQIGTSTAYLGPNETVYFYDDTGDVVCRIDNGSHDFGMTTVQIDRSATSAGAAATEFWDSDELDNRHDLISKTLLITPTDNSGSASYTLTYYLSQTEVNNWITATGNNHTVNDLQFVKSPGSITNVSVSLPYPDGSINVDSFPTVGTYGADYVVSTSFSNGFSGFGAGVPGEAPPESLPVTWGDFQGQFLEGQVELTWTAILLGNHQSFDIQRSLDGEEFISIGEMDIKTFKVGQHTFQFKDSQIQGNAETYIYRIKELDIDGKQDYSPKIEVNIPRDLSYITVGPNPFDDQLRVQVFPSTEGNGQFTLYALDGRQKRLLYSGVLQSGMLKIPIEDVTPGIYFLQFEFEGQTEWIRKIIKR
ncbi:MAG: T9SS type A sorting domain-containing protein, partial [Bacteroidota bacterium]